MNFRDLNKQYIKYKDKLDNAVINVLSNGQYIGGKIVDNLEKRLAEYVGTKYCITCGNGTDALSLVLSAWGIGEGDAVFIPNFTFFATAEVVSYVNATPIFVEVDDKTFNMDTIDLENKIKDVLKNKKLNPKVIIPVDLFGLCADYDEISKIANKYKLLILEDGAQGFGAEYKGKKACSFGDAATTSFFPAKPLGCYGDGGAIFTNDDSLNNILRSLKVHGKGENKYDNIRIGINSRLDTLQAAILDVKLDAFIEHELEDVNAAYFKYNELLKNTVEIPYIPLNSKSSFAQYTIKLNDKKTRDELKKYLEKNEIPTMIYYEKTMHEQTAFINIQNNTYEYPISKKLSETVLSLPMHPYLTIDDINYVSKKIIEYLKQ